MSEPLFRNRARAESFGSVADQYDRARPTYPEALVVDLLMTDPHDVLDVGCGTGKAARLFAARGMTVLGVEIDDGMATVARTHGLDVEVSDFEGWDDRGRRFDLLICGQAWHWIDPVRGARKAFAVLRPGASIALFWNIGELDDRTQNAFDEVYGRLAPALVSDRVRRGGHAADRSEVRDALHAAGFVQVGSQEYPWQRRYDRGEWLTLLGTQSDHSLLPAEQRARVLDAIGAAVDTLGGSVTVSYATLNVTGRVPS